MASFFAYRTTSLPLRVSLVRSLWAPLLPYMEGRRGFVVFFFCVFDRRAWQAPQDIDLA